MDVHNGYKERYGSISRKNLHNSLDGFISKSELSLFPYLSR